MKTKNKTGPKPKAPEDKRQHMHCVVSPETLLILKQRAEQGRSNIGRVIDSILLP